MEKWSPVEEIDVWSLLPGAVTEDTAQVSEHVAHLA